MKWRLMNESLSSQCLFFLMRMLSRAYCALHEAVIGCFDCIPVT